MAGIDKHNWKSYRKMGLASLPANGKVPAINWGKNDLFDFVSDDFVNWQEIYPVFHIWVLLGDEFMVIDPTGWG
jgi:hypothetical protein